MGQPRTWHRPNVSCDHTVNVTWARQAARGRRPQQTRALHAAPVPGEVRMFSGARVSGRTAFGGKRLHRSQPSLGHPSRARGLAGTGHLPGPRRDGRPPARGAPAVGCLFPAAVLWVRLQLPFRRFPEGGPLSFLALRCSSAGTVRSLFGRERLLLQPLASLLWGACSGSPRRALLRLAPDPIRGRLGGGSWGVSAALGPRLLLGA